MSKFKEQYPEYQGDWAWYMSQIEDKPVSVIVDLNAMNFEGRDKLSMRLCVEVLVARYNEQGEPSPYREVVDKFSDHLLEAMAERYATLFVGALTFGEQVDLHYHFAGDTNAEAEISQLVADLAASYQLPYKCSCKEDADWEVYDNFIYPNAYEMAGIQNQKILMALEDHGDALEKERPVEFFADFESEEQAKQCSLALGEAGYEVQSLDPPNEDRDTYSLMFIKTQSLDSLNRFNNDYWDLMDLVDEHQGYLDGWGTPHAE